MNMRLRVTAGSLLLLIATAGLWAQAGELRGRVTDPHGLLLVGADVRVFHAAPGQPAARPLARVLTDAEGRFRVAGLAPGAYRLEVFAAGFERRAELIEVTAQPQQLQIELRVAGVHEGVVVTATRQEGETFETALPVSVVSGETLTRSSPANIAQALENVPGVEWVNAGAFRSRPVLRGLDSNRLLVLVDGERMNNARTSTLEAGIETSLVDLSQIDQIEVVRGPGSVLYGSDAFGGVINLRTRTLAPYDGWRFGARLRGELFTNGDTERAQLELSAHSRRFGVRVAGSAGAAEDYFSPRGQVFRTGVDESSALGEFRYYPQQYRSFFFKFLHKGAYNFGFPDEVARPQFLGLFPYSKFQKFAGGYSASYNSPALSSVQLRVYYQEQSRDFRSAIDLGFSSLVSESESNVGTHGLEFQATSLAARRHALTYGVTHYRDRSRDHRRQFFDFGTFTQLLSSAPSVPDSTLAGTGLFLQDQFELTRRLRLVGGVRVDLFRLRANPTPNFNPTALAGIVENHGDTAVTGNLGVTFEVFSGWVLTGQVARAFREPNLFERYFFGRGPFGGFLVPNAALTPETSLQFDAGTRLKRGPVRVTLNYFHNRLSDLIQVVPGTFNGLPTFSGQPVYQSVNLENSRIQGLESTAEMQFTRARAQWTPFLTVAWQRGSNLSQSLPLPFIAPFTANAGLRWQPVKLRAWGEWRMRVATSSDRVPPGFIPVSGFTAFSFRTGYEALRGERGLGALLPRGFASANFHLGIENVANRHYRNLFELVPQPSRSFRLGLDFRFDSTVR
jgi:outer membrane receptor protein involved in Fe transport